MSICSDLFGNLSREGGRRRGETARQREEQRGEVDRQTEKKTDAERDRGSGLD